ncbi:MAG TPA: guanitoxin biosynthesis pre-guanitoxin forming N-methyltransferase GntF [Povalibacter sp.]
MSHTALKYRGDAHVAAEAFSQWSPATYLATYYAKVEPEERHTLRFLVREVQKLSAGATILEFGVGPTLHHLLPLAPHAAQIHVADLLPANLEAVRQWCEEEPGAFDWREFTRVVLMYEGNRNPSECEIDTRQRLTRERIALRLIGDARLRHPLGVTYSRRYDCVVSCYCADSATADKDEWFRYLRNIASLLAPGGLFIVAALRNCSFYRVGAQRFPSPAIDEDDVRWAFAELNFATSSVELEVCNVPEQARCGFQSIVLASGRIR